MSEWVWLIFCVTFFFLGILFKTGGGKHDDCNQKHYCNQVIAKSCLQQLSNQGDGYDKAKQ